MGSDKSELVFGHETGVAHIAAALRGLTKKVSLVGARDQSIAAGLPNVPDLQKQWGALGGIQAALDACQSEWAVIVACDLPLVTGALFSRLWQFTDQTESGTFDAFVPIQPDGRPQPLCAIYRRSSCPAVVNQLIIEGEHKPRALLDKVRTCWITFEELASLPGALDFFLNVNTPSDYEHAREIVGRNRER